MRGDEPSTPDARLLELRQQLLEALALKEVTRAGWLRVGVEEAESVAAHSWGVAWLVLALCPATLDRGRALAIAVVHDLAEVRVGDITPHDGVPADEKRARELAAMQGMLAPLGERGRELTALWREYEDGSTPEGRFVKACDKLDMALQASRYQAAQAVETGDFIRSALARLEPGVLRALAAGASE